MQVTAFSNQNLHLKKEMLKVDNNIRVVTAEDRNIFNGFIYIMFGLV